MADGRFRQDLYYRLCSDIIVTPPLREQIAGNPAELRRLLGFLARRAAGEAEADRLAAEVEAWILEHLGPDYPWPGNVRELEQCVRNILVRRHYTPSARPAAPDNGAVESLVKNGTLTAEELLRYYCTYVYAQTGSYQETARRLDLDRRTVRTRVDESLLKEMQHHGGDSD